MMADDPHFALRSVQKPDLKPEDLHLRVDWQTLRRLPQSQAVVFNYKALFTPLTEMREEPYIPKLVLKVLREGKSNIMKYKGGLRSVAVKTIAFTLACRYMAHRACRYSRIR
jgi:hypothetical protein